MDSFINIYVEAVPNPESMKFVLNTMIVNSKIQARDYACAADTTDSPLAEELFKYEFTERVFLTKNFITVTKRKDADWEEITPIIRNFLKNYFEEDSPVFTADVAPTDTIHENDSETVKKIKGILDEYIRPAVEGDGGAITFHSFDEKTGVVTVNLQGSCSGCPSSTITLKAGIENLLKRMLPNQVHEVIAQGV